MIERVESIRVIDVLYRVSTRAQEKEGDSLYNQRRSVETEWAEPRGITVRRRVEVAESGRSALRLRGGAFEFSRRLEYRDLLIEYQTGRNLPDAVCVDWADRWSRNTLEYIGIVEAFRLLGIRLLAIGDDVDLTDPRTQLVTSIKSAVAQEQVRITSEKIREFKRSRRNRARWQGGTPADGYRTHKLDCPGRATVRREGADGVVRDFKVRSCDCPTDVLYRDPSREATITEIWRMVLSSPLSWEGIANAINEAGHRRPNGRPFRWNDVYRIAENPHYAGVMATNRWLRGPGDQRIKRKVPLREQALRPAEGAIVDPYITEDEFWAFVDRRLSGETKHLSRRSSHDNPGELKGLLYCPKCGRRMIYKYGLSSKICGNGKPRKSPRKRYVYSICQYGVQKWDDSCDLRRAFRAEALSREVMEHVAAIVSMSDAEIAKALALRTPELPNRSLRREAMRLEKGVAEAEETRRFIQRERANGRMTEEEYERDLFAFRRDTEQKRARLREIEHHLKSRSAPPSFAKVRETVSWLRDNWDQTTQVERAEALRLLVRKVTLDDDGHAKILEFGPRLVEVSSSVRLDVAR